jgi:hypothetical protein
LFDVVWLFIWAAGWLQGAQTRFVLTRGDVQHNLRADGIPQARPRQAGTTVRGVESYRSRCDKGVSEVARCCRLILFRLYNELREGKIYILRRADRFSLMGSDGGVAQNKELDDPTAEI